MPFIIIYGILGILIYAAWERMSDYAKTTFGFAFPFHLLVATWIHAVRKGGDFWDNEALWLVVVAICSLLLLGG